MGKCFNKSCFCDGSCNTGGKVKAIWDESVKYVFDFSDVDTVQSNTGGHKVNFVFDTEDWVTFDVENIE